MHAYLIIAHNNFPQLKLLLKVLDYEDNDIYIHIDLKAGDINTEYLCEGIQCAKITFVRRISVIWGDYSQIECEMILLEAASQGGYDYIHLLSGVDYPIKSHEYINQFFAEHNGNEFVHFETKGLPDYEKYKVRYWYLLHKYVGREKGSESLVAALQWLFVHIQMVFGVDRTKNKKIKYYKGANWFSITGDFAKYIVSQKDKIYDIFSYTHCGDEFFIQTMLMNSAFKDKLWIQSFNDDYDGCLRMIDWERGKPYIFREDDLDILKQSNALFARKFDLKIDEKILDLLNQEIL